MGAVLSNDVRCLRCLESFIHCAVRQDPDNLAWRGFAVTDFVAFRQKATIDSTCKGMVIKI